MAAEEGDLAAQLQNTIPQIHDQELARMMAQTANHLQPYQSSGKLLTDDRAPVELLGMRAIDELIRDELTYYRAILEEAGISGLLHALT